jgi:hypothetical protein
MVAHFRPGAGPWRGQYVSYEGFDFNPAGIARCAVGPELHRAISHLTDKALAYARLVSPGDEGSYQAGFRSGVHVIPDFPNRQGTDPEMARWAGYVQNVSRSAILIEVGSQNTPVYRPLGQTLEWLELVAGD